MLPELMSCIGRVAGRRVRGGRCLGGVCGLSVVGPVGGVTSALDGFLICSVIGKGKGGRRDIVQRHLYV